MRLTYTKHQVAMKTILFAGILFFLNGTTGSSDSKWICEDHKYGYQIEVINVRDKVALPSNICDIISENQKDNEDSYYNYSRYIRIHIFSKAKQDTQPVDEIIYISE